MINPLTIRGSKDYSRDRSGPPPWVMRSALYAFVCYLRHSRKERVEKRKSPLEGRRKVFVADFGNNRIQQ